MPSLKVPRSQPPDVPDAVNVHVTDGEPAFVAVIVTEAPDIKPVKSIRGVLSEVRLSLVEFPLSDDVARSGVPVAGAFAAVAAVESEIAEPAEFVAVSAYRMYLPISSAVSRYVEPVAPEIAVQSPGIEVLVLPAAEVQRYHCEVSVGVGEPVNVAVPVSVSPCTGVVSFIEAAAFTAGAEAAAVPPEE